MITAATNMLRWKIHILVRQKVLACRPKGVEAKEGWVLVPNASRGKYSSVSTGSKSGTGAQQLAKLPLATRELVKQENLGSCTKIRFTYRVFRALQRFWLLTLFTRGSSHCTAR